MLFCACVQIFTRTCDATRKVALMLRALGFGAVPIHGQMSQPKRLGALNKFKVRAPSVPACALVARLLICTFRVPCFPAHHARCVSAVTVLPCSSQACIPCLG